MDYDSLHGYVGKNSIITLEIPNGPRVTLIGVIGECRKDGTFDMKSVLNKPNGIEITGLQIGFITTVSLTG